MGFAWIFAIIVGAAILFLAIFATTQIIETGKTRGFTEAAKAVTILLDPLETGIASARGDVIRFGRETRTHYGCFTTSSKSPVFGRQTLSFSERSGLGEEWQEVGAEISIYNKYIFADKTEQGEDLFLFSKPFYTGYKVSDLIMISGENYCFVAPPNIIESDVDIIQNINISGTLENCPADAKSVCFGFSGCDIVVISNDEYETGTVTKEGGTVSFAGSLVYGAIFSNPDLYECNVRRLGKKIAELGWVYRDKIDLVSGQGCPSVIGPELEFLATQASEIRLSSDMISVYRIAQGMDDRNEDALCRIYPGEDY